MKYLLSLFTVLLVGSLHAQEDTTIYGYIDSTAFMQAATPASPAGGPAAWARYIAINLNYPAKAKVDSVEGMVIVEFIVNANAEIKNIRIVKSISPEIDKEAIRLIKQSKWTAAIQFDRPANYRVRKEIIFKL